MTNAISGAKREAGQLLYRLSKSKLHLMVADKCRRRSGGGGGSSSIRYCRCCRRQKRLVSIAMAASPGERQGMRDAASA